jgi:hypothetical protein
MSDDAPDYNLAAIRELLLEAFTAEDLRRFCLEDRRFRPICNRFGPNHGLDDMVDQVIDHCRTHSLWPEFLAAVQQARPSTYARFADRVRTSASSTQAPPSPPIPSAPSDKGLVSKPIVWVVIAVLILLGGYWLFVDGRKPRVARVALKTAHDRYVTAMGADWDWVLRAETDVIDDYEEFALLCQDDGKIVLQTWHKTEDGKNRYVTATDIHRDWELRAETDVIDLYEEFTLLDADTGEWRPCLEVLESLREDGKARIAFQTWHKKEGRHRLVTAMGADWDWVLRAETTELGANEKFTVILLP